MDCHVRQNPMRILRIADLCRQSKANNFAPRASDVLATDVPAACEQTGSGGIREQTVDGDSIVGNVNSNGDQLKLDRSNGNANGDNGVGLSVRQIVQSATSRCDRMSHMKSSVEEHLDRIDAQLERITKYVVKGFEEAHQDRQAIRDEVKQSIDVYARAVDAYAKQAETYMQEMLALGAKVDRLERQIEQIAEHLKIKLTA